MKRKTPKDYAIELGIKYKCYVNLNNLKGMTEESLLYDIVKAALPKWAIIEWLKEAKKKDFELRQKFGLEPFDKFDSETEKEIKKQR